MVGHRGPGAVMPPQPAWGRLRRFQPHELNGFIYKGLQDELVVDDVYIRVLVRDAEREKAMASSAESSQIVTVTPATGLGQGLPLPADLLVSEAVVDISNSCAFKSGKYFNQKTFSDMFLFFVLVIFVHSLIQYCEHIIYLYAGVGVRLPWRPNASGRGGSSA